MINQPDYDRAATAAMQLLVDNHYTETPVQSNLFTPFYKNVERDKIVLV